MKKLLIAGICLGLASCATVETPEPALSADGTPIYKTITLDSEVSNGYFKFPAQTYRLKYTTYKYDYFEGDLGATSWPHKGQFPQKPAGLCIKHDDQDYLGIFTYGAGQVCTKLKEKQKPDTILIDLVN